jgi:YidC/Oxa1 family membrane protein insertase
MKHQEKDLSANKSTFIAIILCVGLYLAWNQYLQRKYPGFGERKATTDSLTQPETNSTTTSQPIEQSTAAPNAATNTLNAPEAVQVRSMSPKELTYQSKDVTFTFSQQLGSPVSAKLQNYREHNTADSAVVELFQRPGTVQAFTDTAITKTAALPFAGERTANGFLFTRTDGAWKIAQQWVLPTEGYNGKLTLSFTNTSTESKPLTALVLADFGANIGESKSSFFAPGQPSDKPRFLTQLDGSDDFKAIEDFCKDQTTKMESRDKKLDFYGFDMHYFMFALIPSHNATYNTAFSGRGTAGGSMCEVTTAATSVLGQVAPGATSTLSFDLWFGPKEVELLGAFNPKLKTTLGLGWLDMIASPLLLSIKGLYKFTGNYGIAIILLTLLLKILFFPLTKQAAESAARMKKLNPEMTKLRERYKADPQRMQMELMKFMGAHKINPMKGCLPILPTIPVFFALFRVLSASIDLRHAPFYGWIIDLSSKDPYLVTPVILTLTMFIQQRLTPMTGMDETQAKVMMFMPLIFGVMMLTLPSGLVLYMLTNTIVSIAQQQYLNKKFANI